MQVTYLGGEFTNAEAYTAVNNHLGATKTPLIPMFIMDRMLKVYRDYKRDGMSRSWILGEMKKKRVDITAGAYLPSDAQILGFVTALDRLERGDMPANPAERPSWSEAYEQGLGKVLTSDAAKTTGLLIGGAILLYGFTVGLGRGVTSR